MTQPSPRSAALREVAGQWAMLALLLGLCAWLLALQPRPWFAATSDTGRLGWGVLVLLLYVGASARGLLRRTSGSRAETAGEPDHGIRETLVAYASQTGFAQEIAGRTAQSLREAGRRVRVLDVDALDVVRLRDCERCLFVASTTGEGDPPDHALRFARTIASAGPLPRLGYAVLALGDRTYRNYCAFGHQVDDALRSAGARPLFDLVEVDNGDAGALRHWQHHLGVLAGAPELPDWSPVRYEVWRLVERRHLSPGSVGGAVFHLGFAPGADATTQWTAGDIAEVGPRNPPTAVDALLEATRLDGSHSVVVDGDTTTLAARLARSHLPTVDEVAGLDAAAVAMRLRQLPHREYSIASIPSDGRLELVLRRMQRPDGTPGLGSGWLCDHAAVGGDIDLRIRRNANFHPPDPARPMLLVGNGTGIAGLRAHLKARVAAGARRNWLVFGERNAAHDALYADELAHWRASGFLERLDRVFSRDPGGHRYVQDALRDAAAALRAWIDDGASVFVCGSVHGMAPGIDAVLREVLGDARVDALIAEGRYRRDVY